MISGASQAQYQEPIPIIRQDQEVNFDGSYKYRYLIKNIPRTEIIFHFEITLTLIYLFNTKLAKNNLHEMFADRKYFCGIVETDFQK